jgi:BTB/POZ domain-containing protein KCTD9
MIYKATRDGFSAFNFHLKCDNRGPTLTLVKSSSNNEIFGGYTSIPWTSSQYRWVRDDKAFLFTLSEGGKMFP